MRACSRRRSPPFPPNARSWWRRCTPPIPSTRWRRPYCVTLAETPERAAERAPQIERALRGELRAILRDEMKPHYLAPDSDHKTLLDLCMAMGMSLGPEVFARQSRALRARPDHTETLSHSPHPALIACGEHDTLCPLERHTVMRDLMPNATLTVIADAGHLPTLENPDATNAAMSDWLRR